MGKIRGKPRNILLSMDLNLDQSITRYSSMKIYNTVYLKTNIYAIDCSVVLTYAYRSMRLKYIVR